MTEEKRQNLAFYKIEYREAREMLVEARRRMDKARAKIDELHRAVERDKYAAKGIVPGTKVRLINPDYRTRAHGDLTAFFMGVTSTGDPILRRIRKDGAPSRANVHIYAQSIEPLDRG